MNRRDFLRILLATPAAATIDYEQLLWIPGEKTIFLSRLYRPSVGDIITLEMERIIPKMKTLFERDDTFYKILSERNYPIVSSRPMRIPLSWDGK